MRDSCVERICYGTAFYARPHEHVIEGAILTHYLQTRYVTLSSGLLKFLLFPALLHVRNPLFAHILSQLAAHVFTSHAPIVCFTLCKVARGGVSAEPRD